MVEDQFGRDINPYDLSHVADVRSGKRIPQTNPKKRGQRLKVCDDVEVVTYMEWDGTIECATRVLRWMDPTLPRDAVAFEGTIASFEADGVRSGDRIVRCDNGSYGAVSPEGQLRQAQAQPAQLELAEVTR
jgi:hypothetical protein